MNKGNELTLREKQTIYQILSVIQLFDSPFFIEDANGIPYKIELTAEEITDIDSASTKLHDSIDFETT